MINGKWKNNDAPAIFFYILILVLHCTIKDCTQTPYPPQAPSLSAHPNPAHTFLAGFQQVHSNPTHIATGLGIWDRGSGFWGDPSLMSVGQFGARQFGTLQFGTLQFGTNI